MSDPFLQLEILASFQKKMCSNPNRNAEPAKEPTFAHQQTKKRDRTYLGYKVHCELVVCFVFVFVSVGGWVVVLMPCCRATGTGGTASGSDSVGWVSSSSAEC